MQIPGGRALAIQQSGCGNGGENAIPRHALYLHDDAHKGEHEDGRESLGDENREEKKKTPPGPHGHEDGCHLGGRGGASRPVGARGTTGRLLPG